MKNIFVFYVAMLFVLMCACKKDDKVPAPTGEDIPGKYYVRFKADGVQQEMKAEGREEGNYKPKTDMSDDPMGVHIQGYQDISKGYPSCEVTLAGDFALEIGKEYNSDSLPHLSALFIHYEEPAASGTVPNSLTSNGGVKATFTKISDQTISGTFSGIVKSDEIVRVITEGRFFVKRLR